MNGIFSRICRAFSSRNNNLPATLYETKNASIANHKTQEIHSAIRLAFIQDVESSIAFMEQLPNIQDADNKTDAIKSMIIEHISDFLDEEIVDGILTDRQQQIIVELFKKIGIKKNDIDNKTLEKIVNGIKNNDNLKKIQAVCSTLEDGPQSAITAISNLKEVRKSNDKQLTIRNIVIDSIPDLINKALEDNVLSEQEEQYILELLNMAGINQHEVDQEVWTEMTKASIIRDLLNGNPIKQKISVDAPFSFQKNEKIIWFWPSINIYEFVTKKTWQAGSHGVSVRIAKGLYYRVGATKGKMVTHEEKKEFGDCPVAVTNKYLYFASNTVVRISHTKIVGVEPYSDGVIVHRDGARAKPLIMLTNDAWFLANCLLNAKNT